MYGNFPGNSTIVNICMRWPSAAALAICSGAAAVVVTDSPAVTVDEPQTKIQEIVVEQPKLPELSPKKEKRG